MTLELGERLVCVGTDDDALADVLRRWQSSADHRAFVDFGAELHPLPPERRSEPRRLASLRHGSEYLTRSDRPEEIRSALLEVLGAIATNGGDGVVRIAGSLLERDGQAHLVPNEGLRLLSDRALRRSGWNVHWALSTPIDTFSGEALVGPLLGSLTAPTRLPVRQICFLSSNDGDQRTDGDRVASLLRHLDPDWRTPDSDALLAALIGLSARVPVRYIPRDRERLKNAVTALTGR